jgi:hypothetical protein
MDERVGRVEQVEERAQMLLGMFASYGVLPLEFQPAYSVGDLLLQHLDALEQEAKEKGRAQQMLADHFAKVYKVGLLIAAWLPDRPATSPRRPVLAHNKRRPPYRQYDRHPNHTRAVVTPAATGRCGIYYGQGSRHDAMTWLDVVAPLLVIGLIGEILYVIISSEAIQENEWRRSRLRPGRDIAALGRLSRRWRHRLPRLSR